MSLKNLPHLGAVVLLLGVSVYEAERDEERNRVVVLSEVLKLELSSDRNGFDRCFEAGNAGVVSTIAK